MTAPFVFVGADAAAAEFESKNTTSVFDVMVVSPCTTFTVPEKVACFVLSRLAGFVLSRISSLVSRLDLDRLVPVL